MRTLGALIAAAFLLLIPASASAATTHPDVPGREVTRWEQTYTLNADGSADVTVEFDFDFGNEPGHGPYLAFVTQQGYDADFDRAYPLSNLAVSSATGAPAGINRTDGDGFVEVRIGDENIGDVSGVQTYTVSYTVGSVMNSTTADEAPTPGDEFYWNAVGAYWTIPLSNVSVTVRAPVEALQVQCFSGQVRSTGACDSASSSGTDAVFTQEYLNPGEPLTVAALYPAGTFDTDPALVERFNLGRAFTVAPWSAIPAALLAVGGGLVLFRRLRTTAADEEFVGLTPGLSPMGTMEGQVARAKKSVPIAVQFEPPAGMRPGQIGTLVDEKADARDVTATLVDLAVRGYLRIEEAGSITEPLRGMQPDYNLVKLREADGALEAYEKTLFEALFRGGDEVLMSSLKTTFSATMAAVQRGLYDNVTALRWFRKHPQKARLAWLGWGFLVTAVGVVGTLVLAAASHAALIPLPLIVIGIVMMATTMNAPARTATGTAVLRQARGFELYLTKAEARQLRFEEGQDLFSRYLPYAIAFGVAKQWAATFEELARSGASLPEPTWYHGVAAGSFWVHSAGLGDRMTSFASAATATMSAPTPSSSGGSSFGGGGGFSGGGGGGGGGGGW